MTNVFFWIFLCVSFPLFAQQATIIDIKGKALIRPHTDADWAVAQVNSQISDGWLIKTVGKSLVTIAFDAQKKNIVTVKEYTEVKVDTVIPGRVYLPEGRVFALIKNKKANQNFEVRTPTAISGARGTGWLTEVIGGETSIACFDDVVYVNSVDKEGQVTGEIDLKEGLQVNVEERPVEAKDLKEVSVTDIREWRAFTEVIKPFVDFQEMGLMPPPMTGAMTHMPPMNPQQMINDARRSMSDDPEKLAEFDKMMAMAREQFGADFEKLLMTGGEGNPDFEAFKAQMEAMFGDGFAQHPPTYYPPGSYPGGYMPPPNTSPSGMNPDGTYAGTYSPAGTYTGAYPPPPPPPDGTYTGSYPPPPDGSYSGSYPPPPDGVYYDPYNTTYSGSGTNYDPYYDPYNDAKKEADQTMIDQNLAQCGHYCCPYPDCCNILTDPVQKSFCLSH